MILPADVEKASLVGLHDDLAESRSGKEARRDRTCNHEDESTDQQDHEKTEKA